MGNYEQLKQSVSDVIKTNGNKEITGSILQNVLLTIISTVGSNATFAGIATPTTNPGTPDGPVFWIAAHGGTYSNFNAIELQDGLSVLMWNGSWNSQQIFGVDDVPTAGSDNLVKSGGVQEEFSQLEKKLHLHYLTGINGGHLHFNSNGNNTITISMDPSVSFLFCKEFFVPINSSEDGGDINIVNNRMNIIYFHNHNFYNTGDYESIPYNSIILQCFFYISNSFSIFGFDSLLIDCNYPRPSSRTDVLEDWNAAEYVYWPLLYSIFLKKEDYYSNYKIATILFGSISMTLREDTENSKFYVDIAYTDLYFIYTPASYHEGPSPSTGSVSLEMNTLMCIIYYDTESRTFKITSSWNDLKQTSILLETWYNGYLASGGVQSYYAYTTPIITKNNFKSSINGAKSLVSINDIKVDIDKGLVFPYSAKIFMRVGCVGDSYTSGHIQIISGTTISNPNYAWPHYMKSKTGSIWDNYGKSGSTTRTWVNRTPDYSDLDIMEQQGQKCQAYIIGLGLNDHRQDSWGVPVGVNTDIGTDNDTYYAWYYKLIQALLNINNEAIIFCNTCPAYAENEAYNVAVREVVTYCKNNSQRVHCIDLANPINRNYYQDEIFRGDAIGGHYTAIGYEYMAEVYYKVLSDYINSHISEFQDVHLIDYDIPN